MATLRPPRTASQGQGRKPVGLFACLAIAPAVTPSERTPEGPARTPMAKTNSTANPGGAAWMTGKFAVVWASAGFALACALSADCGGGKSDPSTSGSSPPSGQSTGTFGNTQASADGGGIPVQVTCGAGNGASCVATCSGGVTTTYTGTVYDPAGANPLYNVAVYIPNSPLPDPLPAGAQCGCSGLFPQSIVTSASTDASGHFVLEGAPTGKAIPLVVQAGKWRKIYRLFVASRAVRRRGVRNRETSRSLRTGLAVAKRSLRSRYWWSR